jgi:peptide/nickel transport system substrate-binding protein
MHQRVQLVRKGLLAASAAVLLASGAAVLPAGGALAQTLVIGQAGDGLTLDPHAFNGIVEASIMSNLFDPMIAFDKDI